MIDISIKVAGQQALDRIEAWLKANVSTEWHLEFGGIDDAQRPGPERRKKPRLLVRYRFADPKDAEKFRLAYLERRILEPENMAEPEAEDATLPREIDAIQSEIRLALKKLFEKRTGHRPLILPLVLRV